MGAADERNALFFAVCDAPGSAFTEAAIDWAEDHGIDLWVIDRAGSVRAV